MSSTRVLIIYTGGTVGMRTTDRGYAPAKGYLRKQLLSMPQFHDQQMPELTTPPSRLGQRIRYDIKEYEPLLDSSNMEHSDWVNIARDIEEHYQEYDAFIVLHGTDTMAYATAALSFMLVNLAKPVIVTGSQLPLSEVRNDAVENLLGSLALAGGYAIPEVCLFFRSKLFRGNRVRKIDASAFDAFSSGDFPPLAKVGVEIDIQWSHIRPVLSKKLRVAPITETNVAALRIFPGMPASLMENVLKEPIRGVILETFGSGNAPDNRPELLNILQKANDRGVVMVNCTQCLKGRVAPHYAAGQALAEVGVISGNDLTPEAALTKLAYLLSYEDLSVEDVKRLMQTNIRGELTEENEPSISFRERAFVSSVAQLLASTRNINEVEEALYPVLMCSAAANDDVESLERMVDSGASISSSDYDLRTPLHIAAANNCANAVQFLMIRGADVSLLDKWGRTPLEEALRTENWQIVNLLRQEDKAK